MRRARDCDCLLRYNLVAAPLPGACGPTQTERETVDIQPCSQSAHGGRGVAWQGRSGPWSLSADLTTARPPGSGDN